MTNMPWKLIKLYVRAQYPVGFHVGHRPVSKNKKMKEEEISLLAEASFPLYSLSWQPQNR